MIRVLIVEDSPTVQELLLHILKSDPDIEIVDVARTGEEAINGAKHLKPDVITMDVHLPQMNGLEATRRIMESYPTPIVVVSGTIDPNDTAKAFHAVEAGALAVLARPHGIGHPFHRKSAEDLIHTIKLMSEVRVVRRWPRSRPGDVSEPEGRLPLDDLSRKDFKIVAVGASTGGPIALKAMLQDLPPDFPVPIVVVQHIADGFVQSFAEWLAKSADIPVLVAGHGQQCHARHVYVAPDGFHMVMKQQGEIQLNREPPESGLRPSVSRLFRSVAASYGPAAIGVLLTGMGKDGANELKKIKERGGLTIAQDKETSAIHGMPGEAIRIGGATHILSPEQIRSMLVNMGNRNKENVRFA